MSNLSAKHRVYLLVAAIIALGLFLSSFTGGSLDASDARGWVRFGPWVKFCYLESGTQRPSLICSDWQ